MRSRLGPEGVSERRACRVLGQPRNTSDISRVGWTMTASTAVRCVYLPVNVLVSDLARIHRLLTQRGWTVNEKRVHRLWKREHMQVPRKQHRKRRFPAEVRMLRASPCPIQESCVVLRLCDGFEPRMVATSVAGSDRRVHVRMPGD